MVRAAWGHGYASEAARASLIDIFRRTDAAEVISFTQPTNTRSEAVMRRLPGLACGMDHARLPVRNGPAGHRLRGAAQGLGDGMRQVLMAAGLAASIFASSGWAAGARVRACDVQLNVNDPDPAGLNVRAAPGGAVIGALKPKGEWVQVHVVGSSGAWASIEGATLYTEDHAEGRPAFEGRELPSPSASWRSASSMTVAASSPARVMAQKVLLAISAPDDVNVPSAEVLDRDWRVS